jgi:hypothetical protein
LVVERKHEAVILKPISKLSTLRGIDTLKGASKDLAKLREEWNEEFEHGRDKEFGRGMIGVFALNSGIMECANSENKPLLRPPHSRYFTQG